MPNLAQFSHWRKNKTDKIRAMIFGAHLLLYSCGPEADEPSARWKLLFSTAHTHP